MPHQCVRCSQMYEDAGQEILKGCSCGAKLFFFIKKEKLAKIIEPIQLSVEQKQQIEKDVFELIDAEDEDAPVVLDFESIKVASPGKYEIDVVKLFREEEPLVFKLDDGKYVIDIAESFGKLRKAKHN